MFNYNVFIYYNPYLVSWLKTSGAKYNNENTRRADKFSRLGLKLDRPVFIKYLNLYDGITS